MLKNWRLSSFNATLLAAYFIPTWSIIAFRIMISPVHALFERPNVSIAFLISDHLHLSGLETVRAAWLLALARLTVAAFFAIFLVLISMPRVRKAGGCNEALSIALGLGSLISFVSMVMASRVGEIAALRLHATELMLLLGTAIVLLVEPPTPAEMEQAEMEQAQVDVPAAPAIDRQGVATG